jgi:hypothetical protein
LLIASTAIQSYEKMAGKATRTYSKQKKEQRSIQSLEATFFEQKKGKDLQERRRTQRLV